jgi:hypothetical protein
VKHEQSDSLIVTKTGSFPILVIGDSHIAVQLVSI